MEADERKKNVKNNAKLKVEESEQKKQPLPKGPDSGTVSVFMNA